MRHSHPSVTDSCQLNQGIQFETPINRTREQLSEVLIIEYDAKSLSKLITV